MAVEWWLCVVVKSVIVDEERSQATGYDWFLVFLVVGCWHGYLSGARCRLAYGPADATATHCLLPQ